MDFLQGQIPEKFGIENPEGMAGVLEKRVTLEEAIIQFDEHTPHLLPSGELRNGNRALIFSANMKRILKDIKNEYDFIIIDTPPVGIIADALAFTQFSDITLLVIRSGKTKVRHLSAIAKQFKDIKIPNLKLVLNGYKPSKKYQNYINAYYKKRNKKYFSLSKKAA